MIPQCWSVSELLTWAKRGHLEERVRDLLRPHEMVWPSGQDEFERAFALLQRNLPASRRHLLPQALVAAALCGPETAPAWIFQWLPGAVDLQSLGISIPWKTVFAIPWELFPIALADDERALVYYVLVGAFNAESISPNVPDWWRTVADQEARLSVESAARMLHTQTGRAFFFWPLLPFTDRLMIHGPSLALPFYLAARGLTGKHAQRRLLATGKITEDGALEAVGGLSAKAEAADREGLSGFLHPMSPAPLGEALGCVDRFEAQTLHEAVFLYETYQPGEADGLLDDARMLADPERLAASVLLLSEATLRWKGFDAAYEQQIEILTGRKELIEQFLDNLERAKDDPDCAVNRMRILLAPFSEQNVSALANHNPLAAFRVAQLQLANSSRQGRVETIGPWARLSGSLLEQITATERGLELKAGCLNRKFVLQRHGRYDFRPELPEAVTEILQALSELVGVKRRYGAGMVSASLGRLYGTIAQNYGFCGPACLQEVEHFASVAQEAFGGGVSVAFEEDWRRQFCYLFYALLDAGEIGRAREALNEYIGVPFGQYTQKHFSAMNRYQHAALARFLAETGEALPVYLKWSSGKALENLVEHPWQLWLNNVGRFIEDELVRKMVWSRSMELCLTLGVTARPMALLPLANMWQSGLWEADLLEEKTREALSAMEDPVLCRDHFGTLLKGCSWEDILATVLTSGCRLFPFTYR